MLFAKKEKQPMRFVMPEEQAFWDEIRAVFPELYKQRRREYDRLMKKWEKDEKKYRAKLVKFQKIERARRAKEGGK